MKHLKLGFFAAIILFFLYGLLNYFMFNRWGIGCQPDPFPVVVVDDWTDTLIVSGYEPAVIVDEPELPDELPGSVEAVLYAEGTYNDSLSVEISVVETPEGAIWVKAVIDGERVKWRKVEYAQMQKPERNTDWSLLVSGEWVDGIDAGIGVVWEPLELYGSRIGLQAVFDLNADLRDSPDWITPAIRISRRRGAFSLGAGIGYRFGESAGLGIGVNLGIAVGI